MGAFGNYHPAEPDCGNCPFCGESIYDEDKHDCGQEDLRDRVQELHSEIERLRAEIERMQADHAKVIELLYILRGEG